MSRANRRSNKELQELHAIEIAEREKEIERLKEILEETKKTCVEKVEKEIAAREELEKMMEGKNTNGEMIETPKYTRGLGKGNTQIVQLPLNACRVINLKKYVADVLYSEIKLMSDETFKASPKILKEAMQKMGVVSELEQNQLCEATKKEIKYQLSQRRGYSMRSVRKKYKGKKRSGYWYDFQLSCRYTNTSTEYHDFVIYFPPQKGKRLSDSLYQ